MQLVIGRIGKAHGIRGELNVGIRTDEPEERFAVGAVLRTDPAERGPLTVRSQRFVSGQKLVLGFAEIADRTAAETLQGTLLVIDSDELPPIEDDDDFYDHELVGMAVSTEDGVDVGEVVDVVHGAGGDTLVVRARGERREILLPFVRDIVPVVDRATRCITVTPPDGLLEL
ncbi:ribosome maturation factor RimM [Cumulibacter manganitolerans]|uniref:ribosome maturation factor RimM n=1 Tax=Cumulibacter manganitolerans TaxID=1884992 RepID=UPI0012960E23|nr:ribosome maturation factor RimM [Cumulibacter manganitolerans]